MTLADYLRAHGIKQSDFALRIRSHQANVHQWVTGKRRPTLAIIERISEATDGAVRADDFLPSALPISRPKRRILVKADLQSSPSKPKKRKR